MQVCGVVRHSWRLRRPSVWCAHIAKTFYASCHILCKGGVASLGNVTHTIAAMSATLAQVFTENPIKIRANAGYDVGITGGVTSMDNFLQLFFPHVASKTGGGLEDKWCTYNDAGLQMFTSSLFLAACIAGLVASPITRLTTMQAHLQGNLQA